MKFSIVVPTYNEEQDIGRTIDRLNQLSGDFEVLIIDDSSDDTFSEVIRHSQCDLCFIRPLRPEGRCGARNIGLSVASGDIVIVLNADVLLPIDFLVSLETIYSSLNVDYVLVNSEVENRENIFGKYIHYLSEWENWGQADKAWIEWSEGFSLRAKYAKTATFPVGYAVPIMAGEDGVFAHKLKSLGAKKFIAKKITVSHVVPSSLREFCGMRIGRGRGSIQTKRLIYKHTKTTVIGTFILKVVRALLSHGLIVPIIFLAIRRFGLSTWVTMTLISPVDKFSFLYGEFLEIKSKWFWGKSS